MDISHDWLAGFFDGEGCFVIQNRKNKGVVFRITISQAHQRGEIYLNFIKNSLLMGNVYTEKMGKRQFEVTRKQDCLKLANIMLPYLRVKLGEAKEFIRHLNNYEKFKIKPPSDWRDSVIHF